MSRLLTVGESAALSRELPGSLVEFSIGLVNNAIDPSGYPLPEPAAGLITHAMPATPGPPPISAS